MRVGPNPIWPESFREDRDTPGEGHPAAGAGIGVKGAKDLKDGGHRGWKRQRRALPRAPEGASPAHTPIPASWSPELRENKCLLF